MAREIGDRPQPEEIYGQLPDWVIRDFIQKGTIKITPLIDNWEQKVSPTTYDFHLGTELKLLKPSNVPIDPQIGVTDDDYETVNLLEGPYIFKPGEFLIGKTLERLTLPSDIQGRLDGKSSLARIAVGVEVSSARFDPGWDNNPVLELTVGPRPVILRAGMPICAFAFDRLMQPVEKAYNGRYKNGTVRSEVQVDYKI